MQLAIIKNNEIFEIGDSSVLFPNVSFAANGVESSFLEENSAMLVKHYIGIDTTIQKLENCTPYILDNIVYTVQVVAKTNEEIEQDSLLAKSLVEEDIRKQRNQLLKDSDWTQVADTPVDKAAWATYRQALRDITLQSNFPYDIIFPQIPTS